MRSRSILGNGAWLTRRLFSKTCSSPPRPSCKVPVSSVEAKQPWHAMAPQPAPNSKKSMPSRDKSGDLSFGLPEPWTTAAQLLSRMPDPDTYADSAWRWQVKTMVAIIQFMIQRRGLQTRGPQQRKLHGYCGLTGPLWQILFRPRSWLRHEGPRRLRRPRPPDAATMSGGVRRPQLSPRGGTSSFSSHLEMSYWAMYMSAYLSICTYMYLHIYVYMYIYIFREREREVLSMVHMDRSQLG